MTIGKARAYVVSFDVISDTDKIAVMKYYQDRSLYFNPTNMDHTDYVGLGTVGSILSIESKKVMDQTLIVLYFLIIPLLLMLLLVVVH